MDGAHLDFVSRIANPIGVKLGPDDDARSSRPSSSSGSTRTASPGG